MFRYIIFLKIFLENINFLDVVTAGQNVIKIAKLPPSS